MKDCLIPVFLLLLGCAGAQTGDVVQQRETLEVLSSFSDSLSQAALSLTEDPVVYDPSYYSIDYPGGDVPAGVGVCTDVIIRAYRKLGIDLQALVHEDMEARFESYPKIWGLTRTDSNIDHRRVPNLMTFFAAHGEELPMSSASKDYRPGDIVCWMLAGNLTHTGLVVDRYENGIPMIVHNIGAGQVLQRCLFDYEIIGHYRYQP